MSEMTYRTVDMTARIYSGSDDHAKHIVYWALAGGGVLFRDDHALILEELLTDVACGREVSDDARMRATELFKNRIDVDANAEILELKTRGGA